MARQGTLLAAVMAGLIGCGAPQPDETTDEGPQSVQEQPLHHRKVSRLRHFAALTTVLLRATDSRDLAPVWKTSFPISTTNTVFVAADVPDGTSCRHLSLQLTMPGGLPYQRFEVDFATDQPAAEGEQQAEAIAGGYRVWIALPVAGTMIETSRLAGEWLAEVYGIGTIGPDAALAFDLI